MLNFLKKKRRDLALRKEKNDADLQEKSKILKLISKLSLIYSRISLKPLTWRDKLGLPLLVVFYLDTPVVELSLRQEEKGTRKSKHFERCGAKSVHHLYTKYHKDKVLYRTFSPREDIPRDLPPMIASCYSTKSIIVGREFIEKFFDEKVGKKYHYNFDSPLEIKLRCIFSGKIPDSTKEKIRGRKTISTIKTSFSYRRLSGIFMNTKPLRSRSIL